MVLKHSNVKKFNLLQVAESAKNSKYWEKREKNNVSVKKSRMKTSKSHSKGESALKFKQEALSKFKEKTENCNKYFIEGQALLSSIISDLEKLEKM
jgi:Basic region leucine zipper